MPNINRSDKRRFESRFGGNYITSAQYVVEQLCVSVAHQNKSDLPDKFWQLPEWEKFFKWQIKYAVMILKYYDASAIVAAMRDKRLAGKIRSLSPQAAWSYKAVFQEYQKKFLIEKTTPLTETKPAEGTPRPSFGGRLKKGLLQAIKQVESTQNGKEETSGN
jgi:hypothetical protein